MAPRPSFKLAIDRARPTLGLGLLAATVTLVPMACLFPDFTFTDTNGTTSTTGGGGSAGSTTTSMSTGGTTTTPSGGTTSTGGTTGGGGTGGTTGGGGTTTGGGGTTTGGGGTGGETTTSSSMGGTTTSSSTMPPVELCQNGIDDDGDGLIDCKDTADCASFACVAAVPNGWTGYYQLYQGTVAGDPGCSPEYPTEGYVGNYNLNAPPVTCNDCSCGNPTGQVCDPPDIINIFDAPCGSSPTQILPMTMPFGWSACASPVDAMHPNGYYYPAGLMLCGPSGTGPCTVAVTADPPAVTGGSCTQTGGGVKSAPMPVWDNYSHACNGALTTGKGCNLGQTCLPKPKAPNEAAICITKAGDVACPQTFPSKHLYYDDFTDSRTCTGCNCDPPTGATCAGNITVYADTFTNSCLSPDATFAAGTCANLMGDPAVGSAKFTQTMAPSGGGCAVTAGSGQPSGTVTKTFPHTFCCAATP